MHCEFCNDRNCGPNAPLYEGYFYHPDRKNPFAAGTATAGLLQLRLACMECVNLAVEQGMTPRTEKLTKQDLTMEACELYWDAGGI